VFVWQALPLIPVTMMMIQGCTAAQACGGWTGFETEQLGFGMAIHCMKASTAELARASEAAPQVAKFSSQWQIH
jgi:hypothetical protein